MDAFMPNESWMLKMSLKLPQEPRCEATWPVAPSAIPVLSAIALRPNSDMIDTDAAEILAADSDFNGIVPHTRVLVRRRPCRAAALSQRTA